MCIRDSNWYVLHGTQTFQYRLSTAEEYAANIAGVLEKAPFLVAITPDGDIYPCHQFVGIEEWKMGDIFSDRIDQKIKDYFAGIHIYSKENCGNCWARFYCSGGCNANSFIYEGDVKKPHKLSCELQKKRIECAIALAAAGKDAE